LPKNFAALFALTQSSLYFLCLETKKVTKKIQGQTNGSARLSGQRTWIVFILDIILFIELAG